MPEIKIPWYKRGRGLFRPRLKPFLVDNKYKVIPAFEIGGVTYWMFDSAMEIPTGRFMAAMGAHIELESNCNKEYLTHHVKAVEYLLNPPKGKSINLTQLGQINVHLKERIELLPREDAIYKFASVIFFTRQESIYIHDWDYAAEKIKKWKAAGGTLDFFCKTPLAELMPVLNMQPQDLQTYSMAREAIEKIHQEFLQNILSESE